MTLQQLSKHFRLLERLRQNQDMHTALYAAAYPRGQVLSGMPHSAGASDRIGDLASELADLSTHIQQLQAEAHQSEIQVVRFLDTIADDRLRMMFRLRFIHGCTWQEVSKILGEKITEEGAKKACYRYLRATPEAVP